MFVIYKGYRLQQIISQVLLLISALASISTAAMNQQLINSTTPLRRCRARWSASAARPALASRRSSTC
jgi:hypothetical protein